jgi:5-methylcytosine-specific restriction endonuclease McrA
MDRERRANIRRMYKEWRFSDDGVEWAEILRGKQSNLCWWCLIRLGPKIHLDHITPIFYGGTNSIRNLVATHPACNMAKGVSIEMNAQEVKERRKYFSDLRRVVL